jgi:hypothetical protein
VLAPAALLIIVSLLMIWLPAPGVPTWATWLGAALQILLLVGTAAWWGPLMAHLETASGGLSTERHQLLMSTHWIRVGLVSAYALLAFWMLTRSTWQ